jgi:hypothetical protein
MKSHVALAAGLSLIALGFFVPARLHAQQADSQQHDQHHPGVAPAAPAPQAQAPAPQQAEAAAGMMAQMKASGARIDTLVKKMNAATGDAKTEAIAELLTALVEDRRHHESMMANMSGMMSTMHGGGAGQGQGHTPAPAK